MKAILAAVVLFSSSLSFAISDEEAVISLAVSCTIEKFCARDATTDIDMIFLNNKSAAETQLGMSCAEIDMLFMIPGLSGAVKDLGATLGSSGVPTCLSSI